MKKNVLLISAIFMALFILTGCHKDVIDLGNVGLLQIDLKKSYTTATRGAVEPFYAKVIVAYNEEEIVYNCLFSDPTHRGYYSNDASEGDRIYVRKDVEFRIIIEAEIDGYLVSGESEPMMYSDDMDILSVEIILRAGSTRVAVYVPNDDEIFGNYVVAYGEILENVGSRPIHEAGIMLVKKSIFDTYHSIDDFTFDNEGESDYNNWIVEYYYSEQENEGESAPITKFSVVLRDLEPNTQYCMRAFTFSESDTTWNYCYSRVVTFSTNNNVAHDISVITNDAGNVTMESADLAGRLVMLDNNSIDSVSQVGFYIDTYENYLNNNSSTLDARHYYTYYSADVRDGIFSTTASYLNEGTSYVFRAFAVFNGQTYYGAVKMFATPQNPENIRIQAEQTDATLTTSYVDLQGNIISDAGYDFSEVGFVYGFYERGESSPSSAYDLTERSVASIMSGRFTSRINLPIVEKTMYYAPYAITTTGYEVYGDLSSAVAISPESVPQVSSLQLDESATTTHSMTVSCYVDANGRTDCECGIIFTAVGDNSATYDTVKRYSSSSGTEEFVLNNLRKGTTYNYWAYIKVVSEVIETERLEATTLDVGDMGPGGGIIFYADDANGFALEYYMPENGPEAEEIDSAIWGSMAGIAINTDAPSSITVSGRTNTEAIVSYHNGIGFSSEYAALKCYQSTQGGKNDWYLPTSVELQELISFNADIYSNVGFWTSDEQSAENAYAYVMSETNWEFSRQAVTKSSMLNYILVRRF